MAKDVIYIFFRLWYTFEINRKEGSFAAGAYTSARKNYQ